MSDFPDDWFRAGDDRRPAEDTPRDDERWTDQFKPGYRPHPPSPRLGPAAPASPARPETPLPASTASHSVGARPTAPAARPVPAPRARTRTVLPVLGGLLVALVAGMAIGRQFTPSHSSVADGSGAPVPPKASASPQPDGQGDPWLGAVRVVGATAVEASCTATAKPGHDGKDVPSDAARLLDGDASTGWRCDGSARGETLSFQLPPGTRVVGVRMTNGYTKTVDGEALYPQYRRVSQVTWRLPRQSDAWFVQELVDGTQEAQEIRIPESSADGGMQMTIDRVSEPGQGLATRDAVVLTEVEFLVRA